MRTMNSIILKDGKLALFTDMFDTHLYLLFICIVSVIEYLALKIHIKEAK